ncbi:MAG: helix-turn-helix domain-containing protein [Roseovarius sp.]
MNATDLTISDVAAELRIRREHVATLIRSGALAAYDATPPNAKRKSYRITRQALDQFKAERSARQVKPSRRQKQAVRDADFVEYF